MPGLAATVAMLVTAANLLVATMPSTPRPASAMAAAIEICTPAGMVHLPPEGGAGHSTPKHGDLCVFCTPFAHAVSAWGEPPPLLQIPSSAPTVTLPWRDDRARKPLAHAVPGARAPPSV